MMTIKSSDYSPDQYRLSIPNPSVHVRGMDGSEFFLKFNSFDVLVDISYYGQADFWMWAICHLAKGKHLGDVRLITPAKLNQLFQFEPFSFDQKHNILDGVFFPPIELLYAAINIYQGRSHLYQDAPPLVCRCFGIREDDVINFINNQQDLSLEMIGEKLKAGMGCRSCVPQLSRWFSLINPDKKNRRYKNRSMADWIILIDRSLALFPDALRLQMQLESFKLPQVFISFIGVVSQKELELINHRLQSFLGEAVDEDLGFFLIRALQR